MIPQRHPLTRWLAGALATALAASAAPSPAYALRAAGLEENSARGEVENAFRDSPISAGAARASAAGTEETTERIRKARSSGSFEYVLELGRPIAVYDGLVSTADQGGQLLREYIVAHPEEFAGQDGWEIGVGQGASTSLLRRAHPRTLVGTDILPEAVENTRDTLAVTARNGESQIPLGVSDLDQQLPAIARNPNPHYDWIVFLGPATLMSREGGNPLSAAYRAGTAEDPDNVMRRTMEMLPRRLLPGGRAYCLAQVDDPPKNPGYVSTTFLRAFLPREAGWTIEPVGRRYTSPSIGATFSLVRIRRPAAGMEEGWVDQVEHALATYDEVARDVTNAPALTPVRQALAQRDPAGVRQALEVIQRRVGPSSVGIVKSQLLGMAVTLALKALPDSPENLKLQARHILNAVDTYEQFVRQHATGYPDTFPLLADVREALARTPPDFAAARTAADRAHEAIRAAVQVLPPDLPTAPGAIQTQELRAATQRAFEQIDARAFDATRTLVLRQLQNVLEQFPPVAAGMEESVEQYAASLLHFDSAGLVNETRRVLETWDAAMTTAYAEATERRYNHPHRENRPSFGVRGAEADRRLLASIVDEYDRAELSPLSPEHLSAEDRIVREFLLVAWWARHPDVSYEQWFAEWQRIHSDASRGISSGGSQRGTAGMEEPAQAIAGLVNEVFPNGQLTGAALLERAQKTDKGLVLNVERGAYRMRVIAGESAPAIGIDVPMVMVELTKAGTDGRNAPWTPQEASLLGSYRWQWHKALATPRPRKWESGMVQAQQVWSMEFIMDGAAGLADIVLAVKPSAAGMEEPVVIPPGSRNPWAGDPAPPDYVMGRLLVYYMEGAEVFARSLAGTQHARVIVPVPPDHREMADYSVMITGPGEVPEAEKAALRRRHIAVIERQDGMTVEQVIQETIAQWEGRTAEDLGRVKEIVFKGGRLGIYL